MDADNPIVPGGPKPYLKADVVTDSQVLNVGMNMTTVKQKLNTPEKVEAIAEAVIAAETGTPPRQYRFVVSGGNANLTQEFNDLNAELSRLEHARQFGPQDVEVVSLQ